MKAEIDIQKLYELAGGHAVELAEELFEFNRLLNANYRLKTFLEDNDIKPAKRIEVFKEAAKGRSKMLKDLVALLIRGGAVRDVASITEKFMAHVSRYSDVDFAELHLPKAVDDEIIEEIRGHFGGGVRIKVMIDPKVIGGFMLRFFDGRVYDASIAGGLDKLKAEMAE